MAEITAARWASLREQRDPYDLVIEPVDDDVDACLIGIAPDSRLHLFVAVPIEPPSLPPDLQSIEVRLVEQASRSWLDVSARSHHEPLFTTVVNLILKAIVEEGREPSRAVESTIDDMRKALRPIELELGVGEQIGLFGELWVLSEMLFPTLGSRACHLWSGPHGERHDFVGTGVHVEVKTTTRSKNEHEISRLDQLRAPQGKRLLLVSVLLERSLEGDKTLADLIDDITGKLGNNGAAIDTFEAGIKKLGWHEGLRQTGALLRFNLREAHVFEVEGAFPRLPDDYQPPRGVIAIRYTIDVAALPTMSRAEVEVILKAM